MIFNLDPDQIQQLNRLLDNSSHPVVVAHIAPDGDAIGSTLAMYHYLKSLGKSVHVVLPDAFASSFYFLQGAEDITIFADQHSLALEILGQADLVICQDFNQLKRLGTQMSDVVASLSIPKLMIDHHPYPDSGFDLTISYITLSSTSELVYWIIKRLSPDMDWTLPMAEAVLTGMVTDTGGFAFNCDRAEFFEAIAYLLSKGASKQGIYKQVMEDHSKDRIRLMGYALAHKLTFYPNYKAASIVLNHDELTEYHYKVGDTEGFVNIPLSEQETVLSVFFRAHEGYTKCSFRSQGSFPANKIAADYFNGGGHLNAAGGEFQGTPEQALSLFEQVLPQYLIFI